MKITTNGYTVEIIINAPNSATLRTYYPSQRIGTMGDPISKKKAYEQTIQFFLHTFKSVRDPKPLIDKRIATGTEVLVGDVWNKVIYVNEARSALLITNHIVAPQGNNMKITPTFTQFRNK